MCFIGNVISAIKWWAHSQNPFFASGTAYSFYIRSKEQKLFWPSPASTNRVQKLLLPFNPYTQGKSPQRNNFQHCMQLQKSILHHLPLAGERVLRLLTCFSSLWPSFLSWLHNLGWFPSTGPSQLFLSPYQASQESLKRLGHLSFSMSEGVKGRNALQPTEKGQEYFFFFSRPHSFTAGDTEFFIPPFPNSLSTSGYTAFHMLFPF